MDEYVESSFSIFPMFTILHLKLRIEFNLRLSNL